MTPPLVSVIVPTRNSAPVLRACLEAIRTQTYAHIELIVVDRDSTDETKAIAREFANHVLNHGPERSAQRNYGVEKSQGEYVMIIDSDMELSPGVIQACVDQLATKPEIVELVIPEESFGQGFWAQCKRLERSFYAGVSWMEAARCFRAGAYRQAGGYDASLVSGEDWDLSRRVEKFGVLGRINELIYHNEGRISLWKTLRKKYYYAQHARAYLIKNPVVSKMAAQVGPLQRYKLFLSRPRRLLSNPILGLSMLLMKTAEFVAGGLGFLMAEWRTRGKRVGGNS
jgi:glycosyltransferase involved in cell wall biosynthesis